MKKISLIFTMVLFCLSIAIGQRTISGIVTDDSGEALIGASVQAKDTSAGTVTDVDGKYQLKVPEGAEVIVISYTGYGTQEIKLDVSDIVDVKLTEGLELSEVVVTGLGIKREKKALGYAVTTLDSKDVELKPEADIARVLRGKVPGVNITSTSGLAGSGTNVIIRGYSSITGENQPLFVIDGVPMNTNTNASRDFITGGASASSRFLDIDPNNVAEVSVLKGLSATVLYGEAGRNGVVLVTTKSGQAGGKKTKEFQVQLNHSVFATRAASIPDDQDRYGNGWQNLAVGAFSNWGAPFDQPDRNGLTNGQINHPYNGVLPDYKDAGYDYKAYDNLENFFGTGLSNQTSLAISKYLGGGTTINFNYGYLNDEGFIPNNDLKKHNFSLGAHYDLGEKLRINSSFNFITYERNAPPTAAITSSNPLASDDFEASVSLFSNVLYTPRSVDLHGLEYEDPTTHESIYYRPDIQHPLWTLNNTNDSEKLRRFISTVSAIYDLTDWLNVSYRLGLDTYTQKNDFTINKNGAQFPDGGMYTTEGLNFLQDHTFSFNYDHRLSDDLTLDGTVGLNYRFENYDETSTRSRGQFIYDLFEHSNFTTTIASTYLQEEGTYGAFATATLGYRNYLYVNLQGRNDWTSTLEKDNRSVFYPSASISFVPTDAFEGLQRSNAINHLKFRLGYGTSAGYPPPYRTRNVLGAEANAFLASDGTLTSSNTIDDRYGNLDIAPERHSELEFGVESKFLKNRIGLDLSVYFKDSKDLIIDLDLDPASGYTVSTINSASMTNKGVELGLNVVPVIKGDFQWNVGLNFTKNVSNVTALADGVKQVAFAGFADLGNFAIVDQPYGVIQGSMIQRTDDGTPIISSAGVYQQAQDIGIIGDPNPDFIMNGSTTLSWKGLSLRAQIDFTKGGDMYASTPSTLYSRGILQETGEFDRFIPVIVPGVKQDGVDDAGNPVYVENDIQVTSNVHFWNNAGVFYDENRIFDATVVRLREVSLAYDLPASLLTKLPITGASLVFSGQNLWYNAINVPDGANFDPEVASLGVGNGQGFDFVTGPTAKKYGVSLNIIF